MIIKNSFNVIGELIKPSVLSNMSEDMLLYIISHLLELKRSKVISELSYNVCMKAVFSYTHLKPNK
jgi:hypothetical protein